MTRDPAGARGHRLRAGAAMRAAEPERPASRPIREPRAERPVPREGDARTPKAPPRPGGSTPARPRSAFEDACWLSPDAHTVPRRAGRVQIPGTEARPWGR